MSHRRRWVYTQGGNPLDAPVEVTEDWTQPDVGPSRVSEEEVYGSLRQLDGTVTNSRRKLREWVTANGLAHMDDFKQQHEKATEERAKAFTPGAGYDSKQRKEDIGRALYQLETKRGGKR